MTYQIRERGAGPISEIIAIENQDYVEDQLIKLCNKLHDEGINTAELASGLLFTLHYILCREQSQDAKAYYTYLLKQCRNQIDSMPEFYELPKQFETL